MFSCIIFVHVEHSNSKPLKTSQSSISYEGSLSTGNKKSVVSVVLTEEATIPGQFFFVLYLYRYIFSCVCTVVRMYICKNVLSYI